MQTTTLISILQASIAPFVLISGIGLLLLSMTNRIGRPIDLIRKLLAEMEIAPAEDRDSLMRQIQVLRARCSIMRTSIGLAIVAITCVSGITLLLFAGQVFGFSLAYAIEILFAGSMISLIASLLYLMRDFAITLRSLDLEIDRHRR